MYWLWRNGFFSLIFNPHFNIHVHICIHIPVVTKLCYCTHKRKRTTTTRVFLYTNTGSHQTHPRSPRTHTCTDTPTHAHTYILILFSTFKTSSICYIGGTRQSNVKKKRNVVTAGDGVILVHLFKCWFCICGENSFVLALNSVFYGTIENYIQIDWYCLMKSLWNIPERKINVKY